MVTRGFLRGALVALIGAAALTVLTADAEDTGGGGPPSPHGPDGVACAHCHEDPHRGQGGAECQRCHSAEAWLPALFTVADHAGTAFPLTGAHVAADCGSCHVDDQLKGLPTTCSGCHVDRHRGKLGDNCTECHSDAAFRPTTVAFDHPARTGFALTGPHAGVACESCHQGDNGRAMRLVPTATCSTCHAPTHADFAPLDCVTCHSAEAATFAAGRFDHRETGFPLVSRHKAQACSACHPVGSDTGALDDGCESCHVEPHAGQLGTVCVDCHAPDRWRLVRFDHDRAFFPLRGRHFVASCASCHTNQRWVGLSNRCSDCHASDLLRAPASVPAHTVGLADCADCHDVWSFRR